MKELEVITEGELESAKQEPILTGQYNETSIEENAVKSTGSWYTLAAGTH